MKRTHPIIIDISTACPHRCVYCFHQHNRLVRGRLIEPKAFYRILNILKKEGVNAICPYMSGEPMLHPRVYDFMGEIARAGMSCEIATKLGVPVDFTSLRKAMLAFLACRARLGISVELPSKRPDIISKVTVSGNPELILRNLTSLASLVKGMDRRFVAVDLRTIVTAINEPVLQETRDYAVSLGLPWKHRKMGYYKLGHKGCDEKLVDSLLPINLKRYSRVFRRDGRLVGRYTSCPVPKSTAISVDGDVTICCHDMLFETKCGNVLETGSLSAIMVGQKFESAQKAGLAMRLPMCYKCN